MMRSTSIALALGVLLSACPDKNTEEAAPQPAEAVAAPAAPAAPAAGEMNLPTPESGHLRGSIQVADTVKDKVAAGDTIFLMARNGATNRILAVAKLSAPESFPLTFELTGQNVMMPGQALAGKVRLEARVDKDGDAMSRNPGDVTGAVKDLVAVPADDVVLTLDTVM